MKKFYLAILLLMTITANSQGLPRYLLFDGLEVYIQQDGFYKNQIAFMLHGREKVKFSDINSTVTNLYEYLFYPKFSEEYLLENPRYIPIITKSHHRLKDNAGIVLVYVFDKKMRTFKTSYVELSNIEEVINRGEFKNEEDVVKFIDSVFSKDESEDPFIYERSFNHEKKNTFYSFSKRHRKAEYPLSEKLLITVGNIAYGKNGVFFTRLDQSGVTLDLVKASPINIERQIRFNDDFINHQQVELLPIIYNPRASHSEHLLIVNSKTFEFKVYKLGDLDAAKLPFGDKSLNSRKFKSNPEVIAWIEQFIKINELKFIRRGKVSTDGLILMDQHYESGFYQYLDKLLIDEKPDLDKWVKYDELKIQRKKEHEDKIKQAIEKGNLGYAMGLGMKGPDYPQEITLKRDWKFAFGHITSPLSGSLIKPHYNDYDLGRLSVFFSTLDADQTFALYRESPRTVLSLMARLKLSEEYTKLLLESPRFKSENVYPFIVLMSISNLNNPKVMKEKFVYYMSEFKGNKFNFQNELLGLYKNSDEYLNFKSDAISKVIVSISDNDIQIAELKSLKASITSQAQCLDSWK